MNTAPDMIRRYFALAGQPDDTSVALVGHEHPLAAIQQDKRISPGITHDHAAANRDIERRHHDGSPNLNKTPRRLIGGRQEAFHLC